MNNNYPTNIARSLKVRDCVWSEEGNYIITSITWETTGNIHAIGFRFSIPDNTFRYGVFGTNGKAEAETKVYLNYTTDNAAEAMRNYMIVSGMAIMGHDRQLIPIF